jgi:hypothetical protein
MTILFQRTGWALRSSWKIGCGTFASHKSWLLCTLFRETLDPVRDLRSLVMVTPIEVSVPLRGRALVERHVAKPSLPFPLPIVSILGAVPAVVVIIERIERQVAAAGREGEGRRH